MNQNQRVHHLRLVLEDDAEEFAYELGREGYRRSEVEDLTRDWIQSILDDSAKVGMSDPILWEFVSFPTNDDVDSLMVHVMQAYDENVAYEKKKSSNRAPKASASVKKSPPKRPAAKKPTKKRAPAKKRC